MINQDSFEKVHIGGQVATLEQPTPEKNFSANIWDLVIEDIADRDTLGESKYGTRLQGFNGRDALVDAYQEALDLVVYLRQAIYEREKSGEI